MDFVWQDSRRIMGFSNPFTRYMLSDDRLFVENGIVNLTENEVLLYRVQSLKLTVSLWQRIFGVGTICIHSSDQSMPCVVLENIKIPREVKELIHRLVEKARDRRHVRIIERL